MIARNWRPYAALGAGVTCVAWSGLLVRWAGVPGVAAGFYRMAIAGAVLLPWCVARPRGHRLLAPRIKLLALAGGVFFACDNALFNIAVQRTAVAEATLLANVSPIMVGLIAWLMFDERPHRNFWVGLILAVAGCAMILRGAGLGSPIGTAVGMPLTSPAGVAGLGAGLTTGGQVSGDLYATLAALFFAVYLIATERARVGADTLTFTTWTVCTGAVSLFIACVVLRVPLTGYPPRAWAALVGLGLISQLCGYLAVTYALGRIPATVVSVGFLGQAPVTALIAAAFLGERVSFEQGAGGLLVLGGIYAASRRAAIAPSA